MKAIKSVTKEELQYVDDNGDIHSIDLIVCNQNWIASQHESSGEVDEMDKTYVGWRDVCRKPPCVIFSTGKDPNHQNTKLEFDYSSECNVTDQRFWALLDQLKKVGWRTVDLS